MIYADYEYYAETFHGTALTEAAFEGYRIPAQAFIDMLTFHRIEQIGMTEDDVPECVKNAVCALAEYLKAYDDGGGALKASETTSKHTVSYYRESGASKEQDMSRIAGMYLSGTWLAYRGV